MDNTSSYFIEIIRVLNNPFHYDFRADDNYIFDLKKWMNYEPTFF